MIWVAFLIGVVVGTVLGALAFGILLCAVAQSRCEVCGEWQNNLKFYRDTLCCDRCIAADKRLRANVSKAALH